MASHYEAPIRKPLVTGDKTYHDVTMDVAAPVEGKLTVNGGLFSELLLLPFFGGLVVSHIL